MLYLLVLLGGLRQVLFGVTVVLKATFSTYSVYNSSVDIGNYAMYNNRRGLQNRNFTSPLPHGSCTPAGPDLVNATPPGAGGVVSPNVCEPSASQVLAPAVLEALQPDWAMPSAAPMDVDFSNDPAPVPSVPFAASWPSPRPSVDVDPPSEPPEVSLSAACSCRPKKKCLVRTCQGCGLRLPPGT